MMRSLLAATLALALTACGDTQKALLEPEGPSFAAGDSWNFGIEGPPAETLTFAPPGWEVGTQFYATEKVCVAGFRVWLADGETGSHYVKLWTNTGTKITSRYFTGSPGWNYIYFSSILCLEPYTYYRVTTNTNAAQVKTFGMFQNGPITNGPLVVTSGYYGQPGGSFPTSQSPSYFFVDIQVFEDA